MMKWAGGKYHATRTKVDGISFASKLEANRYATIAAALTRGAIRGYCRQPIFDLATGITYRPDFIVFHNDGTCDIVECKGYETREYKLKMKLFAQKYPHIRIIIDR
jgi:hypothetical protein